jgi:carbon starvation protein CstA
MNAAVVLAICIGGFVAGYWIYARWIARRIAGLDPNRVVPSAAFEDGNDFVPTNRWVLFGHHFASIAGLGPILGPAVAVMYGWLPALLWVVFGTIFLGAVHDMMALVISIRNRGESVGALTERVIGRRARLIFLLIIFFILALAMGLFAYIIAELFTSLHPDAVVPVFGMMILATLMGWVVYRLKWPLPGVTVVGIALMFGLIALGIEFPVTAYRWFAGEDVRASIDVLDAKNKFDGVAITDFGNALELDAAGTIDLRTLSEGDHGKPTITAELVASGVQLHVPKKIGEKVNAAVWAAGGTPMTYREFDPTHVHDMAAYFSTKPEHDATVGALKEAHSTTRTFWIWTLLAYALIASVLPVWLLLQPRDYLNSFKLYLGMGALVAGILFFYPSPTIRAPAINPDAMTPVTPVQLNSTGKILTGVLTETPVGWEFSQAGQKRLFRTDEITPFSRVWLANGPKPYIDGAVRETADGYTVASAGGTQTFARTAVKQIQPMMSADGPRDAAPWLFPFLFITIACGAISGFHSLVSSGTTVRQIKTEADIPFVSFGGMLAEGLLSTVVVLAICIGLANSEADWAVKYTSWGGIQLPQKLAYFVEAGGNVIASTGMLSLAYAKTFIAVVIVAFAMTTLDSATRLLRYNVEELGKTVRIKPMQNKFVATTIAIVAIAMFALWKIDGKPAGIVLFELFGTSNQLLAALGLITTSLYLVARKKPSWFVAGPAIFMTVVTLTALIWIVVSLANSGEVFGASVGGGVLLLTVWLIIEALISLRVHRRREEPLGEEPLTMPNESAHEQAPDRAPDPALTEEATQ